MSFNQLRAGDARCSLQPVDILCVEPQEQPLVVEQPQEVVDDVRPVVPRVHLLGPREEGAGVVKEKCEFKNGLRVWDIAVLEATVEASSWRPEVRDAARCADASPHHDHHPLAGPGSNQLSNVLQG